MSFHPAVNEPLEIDKIDYTVAEHPNARGLPYGQEGRAGTVFQLMCTKGAKALKVFKPRFSTPSLVMQAEAIAPYNKFPGLQACQFSVLSPSRNGTLLRKYPDLTYAMLMPWIEGQTWYDVINSRKTFTTKESLGLAQNFAKIMVCLEEHGLAHCDISSSNLIFTKNGKELSVELVDIDGMYGPNFPRPEIVLSGSPGYAHSSIQNGSWNGQSDRFSGSVIMAEMLGWSSPSIRKAANDGSYFTSEEMQQDGHRYKLLVGYLQDNFGESIAECFSTAWLSATLNECPTFGKWLVSLPGEVQELSSPVPSQQPKVEEGKPPEASERTSQATSKRSSEGPSQVTSKTPSKATSKATIESTSQTSSDAISELIDHANSLENSGMKKEAIDAYRFALTLATSDTMQMKKIQQRINSLEKSEKGETKSNIKTSKVDSGKEMNYKVIDVSNTQKQMQKDIKKKVGAGSQDMTSQKGGDTEVYMAIGIFFMIIGLLFFLMQINGGGVFSLIVGIALIMWSLYKRQ